jgi:hypothetical protein
VDERQFSVFRDKAQNHRIYYSIKADGVGFASLVCIFAHQKSADSENELKACCKHIAVRLQSGAIFAKRT